jgi:hypothetical protein
VVVAVVVAARCAAEQRRRGRAPRQLQEEAQKGQTQQARQERTRGAWKHS